MTEARADPQVAREYQRVSVDQSGEERSNDEQHADNQRDAERAGWTLGEPYRDTGSASRYARKRRKDFDALVADLRTDQPGPSGSAFAADVLIMWESSRGSRRLSEWAALLELLEDRGVLVHVTSHGRTYDLSNARDRRTLQEDGTDAEYESAKTSGRVRRGARRGAVRGRPHGRVLYGYRRVYDDRTGALVGQEPDSEQAEVVRRVFADYASGRSARSISAALNDEGVKTRRGNGWTPLMIHRMISNPAYIARRVFRGEDFGPADWPALVTKERFDRCHDRRQAASWHRVDYSTSLLSGLVRCAVCDAKLMVKHNGQAVTYYGCTGKYCVYRPVERLDLFVTAALLTRFDRADIEDVEAGEDPLVVSARASRDDLRAELETARKHWKGELLPRLSTQSFAEREQELLPLIADAERTIRRTEAAGLPVGVDLPAPGKAVGWWNGLDHELRRAVMGAFVVSILVSSTGRGRRQFDDADYTDIEWRR